MKELKAHFGKKITTIKIRISLTQEERDILKEAFGTMLEKQKMTRNLK